MNWNHIHQKSIVALILLSAISQTNAQNVGIGTTTPAARLHMYQPASDVGAHIFYMETARPGGRNVIRMKSEVGNPFQISKYSANEFVSLSGIPMSGGAAIVNDDNGPILINNSNYAKSIYMAANGRVNLTIDGPTGGLYIRPSQTYHFTVGEETDLGIRRDTLNELQSWFEMRDSSSRGNIAGFMSTNAGLDGYGPRIQIGNNSFSNSKVTFWTDTYSPRMFINNNGNVGIGMPDFSDPGAKLYVNGTFKLTDGTQAAGKVLTTDNAGMASWQALPSGATTWNVSGNNISNANTGKVGIRTNTFDPFTKMQILLNSGLSEYVTIQSTSADKSMGIQLKNPDGQWIFGQNIGNYPDGRFNFFYTPTVGATSQVLTLTKEGNLGIGDFTGLGVAPTEKLEIKDGFMKVSGTNKTAFTITATGSNSSGHILNLSYANQQATDILIVTHNYNPPGKPSAYHDYNVGVYWTGSIWTIYNENTAIPILNKSFNVLIIKQ